MLLEERFGTVKPVIAMVHFPGLPGRPRHDRYGGRARLLDVVGRDLEVLQDAGVDAVLFCNEADIPYQLTVGPEIPAAMAAVIGELHRSIRVPFGVLHRILISLEFTRLEPGVIDQKIYAPGIGIVGELAVRGPQEVARLVSVSGG